MSYRDFPQDGKYITTMLYGYMFEEIRQAGAVARAYHGLEELGEEAFHGKSLDYHGQLNETYYAKAIENFVTYYIGVITVIFALHPNSIFRSQIEVRNVFEANTLEELRYAAIEKEVNSLSYKGILDLVSHIESKTGFAMFESRLVARRAARMIEIRNVLVHNRGIVNSRYKNSSRNKSLKQGYRIEVPNHLRARRWLSIEARRMDERFRSKFDVPEDYLRWRND